MVVEILRTPGLELAHTMAQEGLTLPPDLVEGQEATLEDDVAAALIKAGVAKPVEKDPFPAGRRRDPATPQHGHATPAKPPATPPAHGGQAK